MKTRGSAHGCSPGCQGHRTGCRPTMAPILRCRGSQSDRIDSAAERGTNTCDLVWLVSPSQNTCKSTYQPAPILGENMLKSTTGIAKSCASIPQTIGEKRTAIPLAVHVNCMGGGQSQVTPVERQAVCMGWLEIIH